MQKEVMQEERPRKRRKRKKGFGYYLYAFVILTLTITNIALAILLLTHVQAMEVSGTQYSESENIVAWIEEDPLAVNALYTVWKYNSDSIELPVYLEDVKVKFAAPWKLKIEVQEKQIMGGILINGTYAYIDKEGIVLTKTTEALEDLPVIEGITAGSAKVFQKIQVEDEKIFSRIADVNEETQKNELSPDRIVWEDDSMNLYFDKICVKLGKSGFDEKLVQFTSILEKGTLQGKTGTLHLEHYNEMSKNISFEEEVQVTSEEEDAQETEPATDDEAAVTA